jgi:hypothetical protein
MLYHIYHFQLPLPIHLPLPNKAIEKEFEYFTSLLYFYISNNKFSVRKPYV